MSPEGNRLAPGGTYKAGFQPQGTKGQCPGGPRVLACADTRQLDAWLRAALTAPSVAALLSDAAPPGFECRARAR